MKNYFLTLTCFISVAVYAQQSNLRNLNNHFNESGRSFNQGLNCVNKYSSLDTLIVNMLNQINPDSMRQTIQSLQDFGTRFMLAPNRKEVANWIRDKFFSLGINNTVIDSFQTHTVYVLPGTITDTVTWQYNVIATITGNHNPDKVYMTSGHYDSFTNDDPMNIAPGADDDASGVAAAIEIARIIHATGFEPNSTIKLAAFGAEELMHYSSESGASHYAGNAVNTNENIVFYITNDMISCSDSASDWKFQILNHDNAAPVTKLAIYASSKFTSLTPVNTELGNNSGADDLPFYQAGFQTLFFMENDFSPYYHSVNDVVENYNMDYCAEVTKVTASMLVHASETPAMVGYYFISNPGDGNTLIPCWKANTEPDLAGYHIYCGKVPGIYDTIFTTTDTSIVITGLNDGINYFIGVTAFNNDGNESLIVEKLDAPVFVTMDKGILIVNGSEGGIYNPTTEEILQFYDSLCYNFEHEQINASGMEYLSLGTIGEYSTIFWHIDNHQVQNNTLNKSTDVLRNYLNLGGHFFLTAFKPGKVIESIKNYPATYTSGSFMYDCAHIASSENENNRWFSGAYPMNEDYNPVYMDTLKIPEGNHCIPYIEVMTPSPEGDIIYLYDTNFDTASNQGSYYGKVVGIENKSPYKNLVIISFPLFYMDHDEARTLVYKVMRDKFGETYLGLEDDQMDAVSIRIFPNPAKTEFTIEFHPSDSEIKCINIYSIEGRLIESLGTVQLPDKEQKITLNISDLKNGIYILQVLSSEKLYTRKIIKD